MPIMVEKCSRCSKLYFTEKGKHVCMDDNDAVLDLQDALFKRHHLAKFPPKKPKKKQGRRNFGD